MIDREPTNPTREINVEELGQDAEKQNNFYSTDSVKKIVDKVLAANSIEEIQQELSVWKGQAEVDKEEVDENEIITGKELNNVLRQKIDERINKLNGAKELIKAGAKERRKEDEGDEEDNESLKRKEHYLYEPKLFDDIVKSIEHLETDNIEVIKKEIIKNIKSNSETNLNNEDIEEKRNKEKNRFADLFTTISQLITKMNKLEEDGNEEDQIDHDLKDKIKEALGYILQEVTPKTPGEKLREKAHIPGERKSNSSENEEVTVNAKPSGDEEAA